MAYAPNDADAWVPDIAGNSADWTSLITNDAQLYQECDSYPVSAYGPFVSTSTGAATVMCRFAIPGNYDDLDVRLDYTFSQSGPTADVTLSLTDGSGTDTDTTTETSPSGIGSVTVSPSSSAASSTPRYAYITLEATAGYSITLGSIFVSVLGARSAAGVLDSGFESVAASWYTGSAPVPSAIVHVLRNNPYKIAKDRLNALVSIVQQEEGARDGIFTNTTTAWQPVLKFPIAVGNANTSGLRKLRVWIYIETYTTSGTPTADVNFSFGPQQIVMGAASGIAQTTFFLQGQSVGAEPWVTVFLRITGGSGTGAVALRTLQILEEP